MVIKLLPNQVPKIWDAIKFAAANADRINEKDLPLYLNRLLAALLSEKAQCFLRLDEGRQLLAVAITRLIQDEITGEKSLFLNCLYSFKRVPAEEWRADQKVLVDFAKRQGCKKMIAFSNSEKVFKMATAHGFSERYRCF